MKILTLNCQKGYYKPELEKFLKEVISDSKYDFLLLQEVNSVVLSMLNERPSLYNILNTFDSDLGETSHVCILYKNNFILTESTFVSFAKTVSSMPVRGWGSIIGVFNSPDRKIIIGSAHLHPGINSGIRMRELKKIKESFLPCIEKDYEAILAGDFNTGFMWEIPQTEKILGPQLIRANKGVGPTLDSRYTEDAKLPITRAANVLKSLGIGIKLRTDHVYINSELATNRFECKKLPDQVSDHNALEIIIR